MCGGIKSGPPHKKRISKMTKDRKNKQKRRCETRQTTLKFDIHCSLDDCGFTAVNHAGLVNHQRQTHGQSLTG